MELAAICPVGNHAFTYDTQTHGRKPTYCSKNHASHAAMERRIKRLEGLTERWCPKGEHMVPMDGYSGPTASYCRACQAQHERERRANNPDPLRSRRDSLARYGLTPEVFDALLAAQGGRCAICRTDSPGGTGRNGPRGWHVDHDRECCPTRKRSCGKCIRGILCSNCNLALGNFHDSTVVLQDAISYLLAYLSRRAHGHALAP